MAVLEMLAEMVGAVEFLARVAFAKFVRILQMDDALFQVLVRDETTVLVPRRPCPLKLLAAITAAVGLARVGRALVKSSLVARQRRAGPAVPAYVERVLVTLSFVLVLEPIAAEGAFVLLFSGVGAASVS